MLINYDDSNFVASWIWKYRIVKFVLFTKKGHHTSNCFVSGFGKYADFASRLTNKFSYFGRQRFLLYIPKEKFHLFLLFCNSSGYSKVGCDHGDYPVLLVIVTNKTSQMFTLFKIMTSFYGYLFLKFCTKRL